MSEAGMSEQVHEEQEEYAGPAHVDGTEVRVHLRGHLQPIDGRFHWWGRLHRDTPLPDHQSGATVTVETPYGTAQGRLSDADPWGRLRLSGTGRPPF